MNYSPEIQQVHAEFNTAADKLLKEAKEYLENVQVPSEEKYDMLKEYGFTSTKEYRENHVILTERTTAKIVAETVEHYSVNYVNKFIQNGDVQHICKKYGLVCGSTQLYEGFIPKKNLEEIANFPPVREADRVWKYRRDLWVSSTEIIDLEQYLQLSREEKEKCYPITKKDLMICAPQKDFNMEGHEVKDHMIVKEVPDPVVLFPVRLGYLIVTAWGDEASDPLVLNEKQN